MNASKSDKTVKKSKTPLFISIGILAALVLGYFFIPDMRSFLDEAWAVLSSNDEERIRNWVSEFGWMGPVVLVLAMIIQMFLIVIPSIALMVVSILAYGPIFGSIIVYGCLLYTSPSPRDRQKSRMPSSA